MAKQSDKREKFIDAMIKTGGNRMKSAIMSGASEKSASCLATRYMKEKDVVTAIEQSKSRLRAMAAEHLGITQLSKMQILWKHANSEEAKESIRAIAELNKMVNDYDPQETKSDITSAGEPLSSIVILPENNRNSDLNIPEE